MCNRILDTLEKANSEFYPVPTKQVQVAENFFDTPAVQTGYLTKEEFVALYGRCSDVLHAENPFSRNEDDVVAFLFQEIPG